MFFDNPAQTEIPHETKIQLQSKCIDSSMHLAGFKEEYISNISDKLRRSGGRVICLRTEAAIGAIANEVSGEVYSSAMSGKIS